MAETVFPTLQAGELLVHARMQANEASAEARAAPPPARILSSGLQLSVNHDLDSLEQEWRAFEQHADCTVFQCFDWLASWQRHVGSRTGTTPAIVIGRRGSEPLFILPLATRSVAGLRQLTFLGRDLCDYNAPLLDPDFPALVGASFPGFWVQIRDLLQGYERHRHDLILLDKMPERIGAQPNPLLQLGPSLHPSGAYLMRMAGDWESFYAAKRSSATRRRDRTKRKRLSEAGEIRLVTAQTPAEITCTLTALMTQKTRALARMGVPDIFARPGHREFYAALVANAAKHGLAHLSRLQIGPTFAATNLGLEFRGVYYHVLASYEDGPLARFGPGAAHLHELMRYALERGCSVFDFTVGDEAYKRDWCDTEVKLYDFVASATPRGWVMATLLTAARGAKRAIKQSALWPALIRLRARLGSLRRRSLPAHPAADDAEPRT